MSSSSLVFTLKELHLPKPPVTFSWQNSSGLIPFQNLWVSRHFCRGGRSPRDISSLWSPQSVLTSGSTKHRAASPAYSDPCASPHHAVGPSGVSQDLKGFPLHHPASTSVRWPMLHPIAPQNLSAALRLQPPPPEEWIRCSLQDRPLDTQLWPYHSFLRLDAAA